MKNLHLIPTDKPSRLHLGNSGLVLCESVLSKYTINGQHIYITNDEEIKAGDYFWKPDCNMVFKAEYTPHKGCQKIILTTDHDLIKNGVQAIDDEFLEWFVKNPSCEFVEVERLEDGQYVDRFADGSVVEGIYENYQIIIPQKESKQEGYVCPHTKIQCDDECCVSAEDCHITSSLASGMVDCKEPKQETLEEAKIRIRRANYVTANDGDIFEMGVKWQAERMYSEEDMKQFGLYLGDNLKKLKNKSIDEIFEQFKNI